MKSSPAGLPAAGYRSPPSRGAWIEMLRDFRDAAAVDGSPPSRGAWIEIEGGAAA